MQTKLDTICDTISETEIMSDNAARKILALMREYEGMTHQFRTMSARQPAFRKLWDAIREAAEFTAREFPTDNVSELVRNLPAVESTHWPRRGDLVRPMDQVGRNGRVVETRADDDTFYHRIEGDNMIGGKFEGDRYVNGKPGSMWFHEDELESAV